MQWTGLKVFSIPGSAYLVWLLHCFLGVSGVCTIVLTLKKWAAKDFSNKMGLFGDHIELQLETWSNGIPLASGKGNQEEKDSFMNLRGAVVKAESIG